MVWPIMAWRYGRRNARASQRRRGSWRSKGFLVYSGRPIRRSRAANLGSLRRFLKAGFNFQKRDILAVALYVSFVEPFEGAVLVASKCVKRSNVAWGLIPRSF